MHAIPADLSLQSSPPNETLTDELREQLGRAEPKAVDGAAFQSKVVYRADDRGQASNLALQPGDRIRSIHACRTGRVVRVHDDGSAAVHWDDREPRPEHPAHERIPHKLLELVRRSDPASAKNLRRKDYCRELGRVIAHYADGAEVIELARALEGVSASILARRYCPGLNAASYDLFRRYGMKGGVQ